MYMVPTVGLEPTRCFHQRFLRPSSLPIPSCRRFKCPFLRAAGSPPPPLQKEKREDPGCWNYTLKNTHYRTFALTIKNLLVYSVTRETSLSFGERPLTSGPSLSTTFSLAYHAHSALTSPQARRSSKDFARP